MFSSTMIKDTMHTISSSLQIPAIVVLLFFIAVTIIMLGSLLVELLTERRRLKASIPELIDKLQDKSPEEIKDEIQKSGLLKRQKATLIELVNHSFLSEVTLGALARRLLADEEVHYDKIATKTDLIARLGPMFGLMATLIPLGPGLIALGQGDTKTLADSLLIAFDATVSGLASAAVCFVISRVRRTWYEDYLTSMDTLMECILEEVKSSEQGATNKPSADRQSA
jgi:biopolymer transport protein ExbB/TolQ